MPAAPNGRWIYPLDEFYERSGLALPPVTPLAGADVPEPFHSLLVHPHDMTPTLEGAYGRNIRLRVLERSLTDGVLSREVVLVPEGGSRPVAFGVIKINLEHFPGDARDLVLEGQQPLGTILHRFSIRHASRPDSYLKVTADALIQKALQLAGPSVLYGRRNVIADGGERRLAHVVEILPPSGGFAGV